MTSNTSKNQCCVAYREHCLKLIAEWRERGPSEFEDTDYAIAETEKTLAEMDAGADCPWHGRENDPFLNGYRYLMSLNQEDFDWTMAHLGPIQVMPK